MYSFDSQKEIGSSATLTATGDKMTFTPGVGIEIISWGFIITTALSGTAMIATLDKRITAGSDTGRITGTTSAGYGIMTLTTAEVTAGVAGKLVRCVPNPVSANPKSATEDALQCLPGQQAVMNVGTAMGSAGVALPFIEYKNIPYVYQVSPTGATAGVANAAYVNEIIQSS